VLSKFLNNWTLRRYTFVVTSAIFLLFALIVCEGARQSSVRNYYKNFEENAKILTSTVEAASNYDLKAENTFALKNIASRIVDTVPDVVAIVIYNEDNNVLAALNMSTIEQSHTNDAVSSYEQDVFDDYKKIGRIVVGFDVKHRKTVLRNSAINTYLSGIAIIAVCAMLILAMLNHVVVDPVRRIHEHLQLLQNNKNAKTLKIAANKELCHLADTVNEFGNVLELRKQKEHELKEVAKAKTDFLANMSHELRTPMNGVLGMLTLLRETKLNPQQDEQIKIATNSSKNLLTLINDILDFSKLEAGKLDYETVEFELEDIIDECAESVSEAAYKNNVDFICEIDRDIPVKAIGDPTRLRQVITNLTGNAIKFTTEGVICIRVAPVEDPDKPNTIKFSIIDTGLGISEQAQLKLFNSFEQADSSTTRKFGGTGLGLAISRRLVEGMGGQIGVDSKLHQGSTFWFTLDLPAADDRTVYQFNQIDLQQPLNLLLVEPIDSSRSNISSLLLEHQTSVEHANRGDEALAKMADAQKQSKPYDIVYFTTKLNDMSAREFTRSIDNNKDFASVKLVAINTVSKVKSNLYTHTDNRISTQLSRPARRKTIAKSLNIAMQASTDHPTDNINYPTDQSPLSKEVMDVNAANDPSTITSSAQADVFHDIHILVAEDNLINQYVTQSMLENMGFNCVVADNGQIALDILNTTDIDLILMDCQMPVLDGFKTTQQIRAAETDTRLPIIALTANAMQGDAQMCFAAGMDSFLTKPIDKLLFEKTILETLEDLINQRSAEQASAKKAA